MESPQGFTEEINFHDLEMIQVVGEGAFGVVSKARLRGKVVAVKLIQTESERKAFLTELKQLSRVNHPNIVKLYGACTSPRVCLVMEYAEGGSLYNVLHVHGANRQEAHYTAAHAVSWLLQCARGVEYLHSMKPKALIHRDLKPPNLLLVTGGTMLKICDFGTACDAQTHMTNNKGSAAWMAPEVFEGCNYSEKCDVFSFGIILWEVFTRRKPFDEIGGPAFRIMWAVHNGTRPPLIKDLPKPLELLMTRCWSANAAERPSMSEVVRIMSRVFQFFKGADEPLKYINGATDSDEYNPVPSTMGAWSQASGGETQPITGESRGGTMTKTIRHAAGEPVSVLPPTPMQPVFTPPVVLEDESPRGGISCPPSLAASLESLDKPSSRSGTPVNPFKRHSTDLSILDEYDTVGQGNAAPKSKHHNRTGSDESCRVSPGDPTPQSSRASPARTGTSPSGPTRLPHVHSYPVIDRQSSAMTTGPIQATEPSVNGQHLAAANRSISWAPGATTANTVPVVNGLPCNTTDASVMNMVYLSLDHQLQPLEPAPNSKESLEIFRQHCQLAEQYLKVQTEIALLMQRKHELINEYEQGEKKGEQSSNQIAHEYFQLRTENDSLSTLRNNLEKQVAHIRRQQQQRKITT